MSSIIRNRDTFHGIRVESRGVFTNAQVGSRTYAGQCKDGYACGLGLTTSSCGSKQYAEHGPDGQNDGRCLDRDAYGTWTWYTLFERGKKMDGAIVSADGRCWYNGATSARACADSAGRPGRGAPRIPSRPPATRPLSPRAIVR